MSKERENEIAQALQAEISAVKLLVELLTLRRERHRDRLEKREGDEFSGRALECRDLLQILG